jgi:hypothetical protein
MNGAKYCNYYNLKEVSVNLELKKGLICKCSASLPPESCIFSQLINIGALLVAITIYIRYKQVNTNNSGL